MLKLRTVALASAILALGLSACGGSSSSSSATSSATSTPATSTTSAASSATTSAKGGAGSAVAVAADPSGQLKYTKSTLSAKAGKVTIQFTNGSPLAHNLTIQQGTSGAIIGATPTFQGGSKTLTVNLKAGTYTYFCTVPGHRMAGMQGTLTVS